jgi:ribosome maturation factor RimP
MSHSDVSQRRLWSVVEPVVSAEGFEVESLTVTAAGRRSILRLTVDADEGVDLDSVARLSRAVSDALDEADAAAFAGPYSLEVSSPGVDRPLTDERHWRRATGRLVTVNIDGKPVTARVTEVKPSGVTLRDASDRTIVAGWSTLGAGRVQVEFNRPAEWDTDDEDAGRP